MSGDQDAPTERAAQAIAAHGLTGNRAPQDGRVRDWTRLLPRVAAERLGGIALAAAAEGALDIPQAAFDRLMDLHRDTMMWSLTLERALGSVLGALAGDGIEPVLLKGPVMAHVRYPDPSWRPFADLDLLVRAGDRPRASAALAAAGFRPSRPEPRRGFDDRFGKAVVHRGPSDVEIDLHRTLAQGPFVAWIDPAVLIERTVGFTVAGITTRRFDDTGLFVHACVHAALGDRDPNLLMLRDVAQCWSAPDLDWVLVAELARSWRLGAVLRRACALTSSRLHVPLPEPVRALVAAAPDRGEVRVLRAYTGPRRGRGGTELALLTALPGVRERAAYATSLLVPSREFLRARAQAEGGSATYAHRWTHAARALSRKRRG